MLKAILRHTMLDIDSECLGEESNEGNDGGN